MIKIIICITARPSYSRIKSAIQYLQTLPEVEVFVLASGSALLDRYGRVVDLIKKDGITVIDELYTFVEGNTPVNMALTTASTIEATARILVRFNPDLVVTIADRYETMGTAIAASYCGIPLAHVQGGEITGNIDERVRHAITKLADIHLVANREAADRVRRMGEPAENIFITGCPSIDLVKNAFNISQSEITTAINSNGVGAEIDITKKFLVLLQHPETDRYDASSAQMTSSLEAIDELGIQTLIFWPNVDAGSDATSKAIRRRREQDSLKNVRFIKNLEGAVFLRLLHFSGCLVGNSSVGIRECSYLGVPVVNIGERQNGRLFGNNVLHCEWDTQEIIIAIKKQLKSGGYPRSHIYGEGNAGERIGRILATKRIVQSKRFVD